MRRERDGRSTVERPLPSFLSFVPSRAEEHRRSEGESENGKGLTDGERNRTPADLNNYVSIERTGLPEN